MLQAPAEVEALLYELLATVSSSNTATGAIDAAEFDRRLRFRRSLRAPCEVFCHTATDGFVRDLRAVTRNVTEKGISVTINHPQEPGYPVEIAIRQAHRPPMFLAGTVVFCRHTGTGAYKIGIDVRDAGIEPIFSHNPVAASQSAEWLGAAMRHLPHTPPHTQLDKRPGDHKLST